MFAIETAWTCYSNTSWHTQFLGSNGTYRVAWEFRPYPSDVQYDWTCTCPSFVHQKGTVNGYCKHILQVAALGERCTWNAELEPGRHPEFHKDSDPICPKCKGRVEPIKVAV